MQKLVAVLNVLLVAGYPVAVYFGLTRFSARGLGLLLIGLLVPGLVLKLRTARREDLLNVLRVPLSVLAVAGLAALLNDKRLVLAQPVLINIVLLLHFGGSLRATPLVERFARMQDPNLRADKVAYCREVTKVWCGFFGLNALISGYLALSASVATWALYTGFVAYVLIGVVATSEYVFRKFRFRDYGSGLHDRLLARVFPPRVERGEV